MGAVRALWAWVQMSPVAMRRVNGYLAVAWACMIPVSIITGWLYSVGFVSMLSLWALVSGHLASYQAARVEVRQDEIEGRKSSEEGS